MDWTTEDGKNSSCQGVTVNLSVEDDVLVEEHEFVEDEEGSCKRVEMETQVMISQQWRAAGTPMANLVGQKTGYKKWRRSRQSRKT